MQKIVFMRLLFFISIVFLFSCGEDKHQKDTEENTYYSKYLEIYNMYDSVGAAKTIDALDMYIAEFPNAQKAYIFKAWVLANNNELNKIDAVLETALTFDTNNAQVFQYWAALLLKDSNNIQKASTINQKGREIAPDNLFIRNNNTWIYLFEKNVIVAEKNAFSIVAKDTTNNPIFFHTAAVSFIDNDSLHFYYKNMAVRHGFKDTTHISQYKKGNLTIFELYNKL